MDNTNKDKVDYFINVLKSYPITRDELGGGTLIPLTVESHKGHHSSNVPLNVLNDNSYTKYASALRGADNDWIIFKMNEIYLIKSIKIKGDYSSKSIKTLSIYLGNKNKQNRWHEYCNKIDGIKNNDKLQTFCIECIIDKKKIFEEKLMYIKIQFQNHGSKEQNVLYQFHPYGIKFFLIY